MDTLVEPTHEEREGLLRQRSLGAAGNSQKELHGNSGEPSGRGDVTGWRERATVKGDSREDLSGQSY